MGSALALVLSMTIAGSASANTGSITSSQSCSAGAVHVYLNNNVSSDRKVTVTSTIPGFTTTDITNKSYNTTGNSGPLEIWSASGPQPFAGVVTLTIKRSRGSVEATYSKTMTAQDACPAPGFSVDKGVALSAAGPFVGSVTTTTGTTVHYRIRITNTGNVVLTGVTLSDNTFNLAAKGCTIPTNLAVGAHYDCTYSTSAVTGTTTNIATGDTTQTGPDTDTATVVAAPAPVHGLTITKTNNAPITTLHLSGSTQHLPTADEGHTVVFTLHYTLGADPVAHGVITDVVPHGLTYVAGSATSNGEFTFDGYNAHTRTLSWVAEDVTASGSVRYNARVATGASELSQPLINVATIDSGDTAPDSDSSKVFVPVIPLGETDVPTAPPTDALSATETSQPGSSLPLILAILGMLIVGTALISRVPATARGRDRR